MKEILKRSQEGDEARQPKGAFLSSGSLLTAVLLLAVVWSLLCMRTAVSEKKIRGGKRRLRFRVVRGRKNAE